MTVSTTTSVVSYLGNGATTLFTFSFIGVSADDLEVIITDPTGVQTTLSQFQYTLVINAAAVGALWGIGGSVTYPISGSPLASGYGITINRIVPFEQNISINNQGAFYPISVEQMGDLLEMQLQQIETTTSFALTVPTSDITPPDVLPPAAARADGYLSFDSSGQPIISFSTPSPIASSVTPRRVVTTGTATVGMSTTDSLAGISIYQGAGSVTTVQLPSTGGPYPIFDGGLNAGTYPIKILPGTATVLGNSQYSLNFNGQSATFYIDSQQTLMD